MGGRRPGGARRARALWSARASPRFGTGRHVAPWESGDVSPHSKPAKMPPGVPRMAPTVARMRRGVPIMPPTVSRMRPPAPRTARPLHRTSTTVDRMTRTVAHSHARRNDAAQIPSPSATPAQPATTALTHKEENSARTPMSIAKTMTPSTAGQMRRGCC